MYCSNCGKEVLESDRFCPFCGEAIKAKKIIIDNNIDTEILKKRAFLLIEDGDFQTADDYLDSVLNKEPENGEAYLGKLMVQEKKNTVSELFDGYKELYNDDHFEIRHASGSLKDISSIIDSASERYVIPNYLEKEEIEDLYKSYDSNYESNASNRRLQKEKIVELFDSDRLISKVKRFSSPDIIKCFDDVIDVYEKRINEAEEEDTASIKAIKRGYNSFLEKTGKNIEVLYEERIQKREDDYQKLISGFEAADDIDELNAILESFAKMKNYKESIDYIEKCKTRIEELSEENRMAEEEKAKKTKQKLLLFVAALVLCSSFFFYYKNVIVPENRYRSANELLSDKKYDEAASIFADLGDYKDAKQMHQESIYRKATELLEQNRFAEAVSLFEVLGTYEESEEKLSEAEYGLGKQLLEQNDYDKAIELFVKLENYQDCPQLVLKAKYCKALLLRENKEYDASIALFEDLADYEDSKLQLQETEKEKQANSVEVPTLTGKTLESAREILKKAELDYTVVESSEKNKKVGSVIGVEPAEGTLLLKGSSVTIKVAKGSSKYSNYEGDRNTVALFQIGINNTGNNLRIRSAPTTADDNKIENAKAGDVFNVYETMENEGYTWYRIGTSRWIAYDAAWVNRDAKCDQYHGSFEIYDARIEVDDHLGVYSNPVENENQRSWVRSIYNGDVVKIYYTFNNGSHVWYKVGINEWIKDFGGDRVKPIG